MPCLTTSEREILLAFAMRPMRALSLRLNRIVIMGMRITPMRRVSPGSRQATAALGT